MILIIIHDVIDSKKKFAPKSGLILKKIYVPERWTLLNFLLFKEDICVAESLLNVELVIIS